VAKDYAKQRKSPAKRPKAPVQRKGSTKKSSPTGGLRIFVAGLLSGVFLCFLAYLTTLPPKGNPQPAAAAQTQADEATDRPRFEFYTMLPEQTLDVEAMPPTVDPAADVRNPASERYLLQAGSFRLREDADRRRAQLILLGLEPTIAESETDNGRWNRVYIGPFETREDASRARALTAGQDIDTLMLKRGQE
jgi:cell division protein FtsN